MNKAIFDIKSKPFFSEPGLRGQSPSRLNKQPLFKIARFFLNHPELGLLFSPICPKLRTKINLLIIGQQRML